MTSPDDRPEFIHQTAEGPLHDGQNPLPSGWYWSDDFQTQPCSGPWPSKEAVIEAGQSREWDLTGYNFSSHGEWKK